MYSTVSQMNRKSTQENQVTPYDRTKYRKLTPYEKNQPKRDMDNFLEDYFQLDSKAMIYAVLPQYCEHFIPVSSRLSLPDTLSGLYRKDLIDLSFSELISHCEAISEQVQVTQSESDSIESLTRSQSKSKLWFSYRIGRITASVVKSVVSTSVDTPALSLIQKICQPNASFHAKQTEYKNTSKSA